MADGGELQEARSDVFPANPSKPAPKPHYLGHLERLRDRTRTAGFGAMPDYEFLELYVFRTIPRGDVKPLAKALIVGFGSLPGVLGASVDELKTVVGWATPWRLT